jgi:ceramide glucosyltransferase
MSAWLSILQGVTLLPVAAGTLYAGLSVFTFRRFHIRAAKQTSVSDRPWPAVTILKPVCGLEKNLEINLTSACTQDYPDFQVIFSVHDSDDTALPILKKIKDKFPDRTTLTIADHRFGPNRKINNLTAALSLARNPYIVISDSDIRLKPDYLKHIIAPLSDPQVAFACTLYKAVSADRWFEKLEALTLDADFVPSVVFAYMTGASPFCLGASVAFRKEDLCKTGGFEALAGYLAEDYELGRRLLKIRKRIILLPEAVDTVVDLNNFSQWWTHQVTWDQKTRAAQPSGFMATLLTRLVPFAILFFLLRKGDETGLTILVVALLIRMITVAANVSWGLKSVIGWKELLLLPVRDIAAFFSWGIAMVKGTVNWRGIDYRLRRDGHLEDFDQARESLMKYES